MSSAAEVFGRNLRAIRKRAGLTQEGLQFESDVHRTVISKLERGETGPHIETIVKLARSLGVPVGDLFVETQPGSPGISDAGSEPKR